VAVGVPDRALTPNAGLAAVTGLCDRLGVIGALDAAVGPVKQRDRGFGAGQLLTARPGTRGKERPAVPAKRPSGPETAAERTPVAKGVGTGPPSCSDTRPP
jgi:hypothetical protein